MTGSYLYILRMDSQIRCTRFTVASAMAEAIAQSAFLSKAVARKLAGKMPVGVYLLQVYGFQQKAAMAARAQKAIDPSYYWILYQAKLEMLYYFVEPASFRNNSESS